MRPSKYFRDREDVNVLRFASLLFQMRRFVDLRANEGEPENPIFVGTRDDRFVNSRREISAKRLVLMAGNCAVVGYAGAGDRFRVDNVFRGGHRFVVVVPIHFVLSPELHPSLIFVNGSDIRRAGSPVGVSSLFHFRARQEIVRWGNVISDRPVRRLSVNVHDGDRFSVSIQENWFHLQGAAVGTRRRRNSRWCVRGLFRNCGSFVQFEVPGRPSIRCSQAGE